jgi:hypothetical protein
MLLDGAAHFARSGSSSLAKNTEADFRISFARAQLEVLAAQLLDLLPLLAGEQIATLAAVGLGLPHRSAQRLRLDAQVTGDVRDRTTAL